MAEKKLSPHQEAEAAAAYVGGATLAQLAARYAVSEPAMLRYLRRAGVPMRPAIRPPRPSTGLCPDCGAPHGRRVGSTTTYCKPCSSARRRESYRRQREAALPPPPAAGA